MPLPQTTGSLQYRAIGRPLRNDEHAPSFQNCIQYRFRYIAVIGL